MFLDFFISSVMKIRVHRFFDGLGLGDFYKIKQKKN